VDASEGSVRTEILSEDGQAVPGFATEQSVPVEADSFDVEVAWGEGAELKALKGRTVRLRFQLTNARLYAYGFGDDA